MMSSQNKRIRSLLAVMIASNIFAGYATAQNDKRPAAETPAPVNAGSQRAGDGAGVKNAEADATATRSTERPERSRARAVQRDR